MPIYVCGDTHGLIDFVKITQFKPQPNSILIHLGDFGCLWHYNPNKNKRCFDKWAKYMQARKFNLLVIPGNHENYDMIYRLPTIENPIDDVQCECAVYTHTYHPHIYTNIYFLINPELVISGKRFLVIHGATSQDKVCRIPKESWWEQEEPRDNFWDRAEKWIEKNDRQFDYIVSHTAPTSVIQEIKPCYVSDAVGKKMQILYNSGVKFKEWHFGHLHKDIKIEKNGKVFVCHYGKIEKIIEGGGV